MLEELVEKNEVVRGLESHKLDPGDHPTLKRVVFQEGQGNIPGITTGLEGRKRPTCMFSFDEQ